MIISLPLGLSQPIRKCKGELAAVHVLYGTYIHIWLYDETFACYKCYGQSIAVHVMCNGVHWALKLWLCHLIEPIESVCHMKPSKKLFNKTSKKKRFS